MRHSRHNGARVDSTAKERAKRNIANQADADRLENLVADSFGPLFFRAFVNGRSRHVPIRLLSCTAAFNNGEMSRQYLLYSFEERIRSRYVAKGKILLKSGAT